MYLQEKIKEIDNSLKVFEIKDKRGLWIISLFRGTEFLHSVSGNNVNLPFIYKQIIEYANGISGKS